MSQAPHHALTLSWDAEGTALLPTHGLAFCVSDDCGEEPYQGFYWREESANRPHGSYASPQEAQIAAQDWVLREVPKMAFLVEVASDDAQEENIPAGYYLLRATHLPALALDGVHDGICLLGHLNAQRELPPCFKTQEAARTAIAALGLTLHRPVDFGLV